MDGIPLASIPPLVLYQSPSPEESDVQKLICDWLLALERVFVEGSFNAIPSLFIEDCWWRDIVGLSWDYSSKHGHEATIGYLNGASSKILSLVPIESGSLKPMLLDIGGMVWIQGGFEFSTAHGHGRGIVKLANVQNSQWKAWSVFTQLESLTLQSAREPETPAYHALSNGSVASNGINGGSNSDEEVQVLIVGAGQSGLALGARLQKMGIKTLLIDRHARLGDSWRKRYRSIRLHTPSYTDSYPFLAFPKGWPKFPSRDMIAEFAEHYGNTMELNVLLNATMTKLTYMTSKRKWEVVVQQPQRSQTLTARHVVLATGVYADAPIIPDFPGTEDFQGHIYHSSQHQSATQTPDLHEKNVAVVGAGPSAHDVAQDFVNHRAKSVSMIQRQPIFSVSMEAMEKFIFFLWNLDGVTTEDADLIGNATPLAVIRTMSIGATKAMAEHDRESIAGLKNAGLALRVGDDGYGIADHQLIKGGQYYINQGAHEMIINGSIRIHQCIEGIKEFDQTGLTLADGRHVDADVVVLATGYQRSVSTAESFLGPEFAGRLKSFGDLDHEQERGGWWRNTGVPGFWYMTGSFMWSRQFSLALALQIAAVEHGLNEAYYSNNGP